MYGSSLTLRQVLRRSRLFARLGDSEIDAILARIGEAVQVINNVPASDTDRTIQALNGKNLKLSWLDGMPATLADSQSDSQADSRPRRLLAEAIRSNFIAEPPPINVLKAYLFEAPKPKDVLFTMNNLQWQRGAFSVQVRMRNERWLQIDCDEGEGGFVVSPWTVYYRWIVPVVVITFVLALNNFAVPAILQVKVFPAETWVRFSTTFDASPKPSHSTMTGISADFGIG